MTTLLSVITQANDIKPNAFSNETKTAWINEVEGMVQTEVFLWASEEIISYSYAEDSSTELLVRPPHDKLYWAYLAAMIDFANGEYANYQNAMQLFNSHFTEFMRWFALNHRPADTHEDYYEEQGLWRGYYISAYGVAVKHGFSGSEEDWLRTLIGEKGDGAELRYENDVLEWRTAGEEEWHELISISDIQGEVIESVLAAAEASKNAAEEAQGAAEAARDGAVIAKTAAEAANSNAEEYAEAASGLATAASSSAALALEAKAAAEDAQGMAEAAKSDANAAAGSAIGAAGAAETARDGAVIAKTAAEAASSSAEECAEAASESAAAAHNDKVAAHNSSQKAAVSASNAAASANAAELAKTAAETSAAAAALSENIADTGASEAFNFALAAEVSKNSASAYKQAAEGAKLEAIDAASNAAGSALLSRSWAVGGTGTRAGEDTNNAQYWAEQAQAAAGDGVVSFNRRSGSVMPQSGDYSAAMVGADAAGAAAAVQANLDVHAGDSDKHATPAERAAWNAKYDKPAAGIPTTDLSQEVCDALNAATEQIGAERIALNAVTSSRIASGAVISSKLADGAVTGSKISSNAVTEAKLSADVQASLAKAATALQAETDPTVPAWAKAPNKPAYAALEVGAVPAAGGTFTGPINTEDWLIPKYVAFADAAGISSEYVGFYKWGDDWSVNRRNGNNQFAEHLMNVNSATKAVSFYGDVNVNGQVLAKQADVDEAIEGLESKVGAASGVASLGADGKVPSAQLPSLDYIPNAQKGVAGGVATLGADGKVSSNQISGGFVISATAPDDTSLLWVNAQGVLSYYDGANAAWKAVTAVWG